MSNGNEYRQDWDRSRTPNGFERHQESFEWVSQKSRADPETVRARSRAANGPPRAPSPPRMNGGGSGRRDRSDWAAGAADNGWQRRPARPLSPDPRPGPSYRDERDYPPPHIDGPSDRYAQRPGSAMSNGSWHRPGSPNGSRKRMRDDYAYDGPPQRPSGPPYDDYRRPSPRERSPPMRPDPAHYARYQPEASYHHDGPNGFASGHSRWASHDPQFDDRARRDADSPPPRRSPTSFSYPRRSPPPERFAGPSGRPSPASFAPRDLMRAGSGYQRDERDRSLPPLGPKALSRPPDSPRQRRANSVATEHQHRAAEKRKQAESVGPRDAGDAHSAKAPSDRAPSPPISDSAIVAAQHSPTRSPIQDSRPFDPGVDQNRRPSPLAQRPQALADEDSRRSITPPPLPPRSPERTLLASPFRPTLEVPSPHLRQTSAGGFAAHREALQVARGSPVPPSPTLPHARFSPPKAQPSTLHEETGANGEQRTVSATVRDELDTQQDVSMEVSMENEAPDNADRPLDDGFTWSHMLGHVMNDPRLALAPIKSDLTPALPPKADKVVDLFAELDAELLGPVTAAHAVFERYIYRDLADRAKASEARNAELKETYRALNDDWQAHIAEVGRGRERRDRPMPAAMAQPAGTSLLSTSSPAGASRTAQASAPEINSAPIMLPSMGRTRRMTGGGSLGFTGDMVRSEAEFLAILASLESDAARDPTMRAKHTAAVIPDQLGQLDAERYLMQFDDRNSLVKDPETFYGINAPAQSDTSWTEDEVDTFIKRYAAHPKNFGKIAIALPDKTVRQCVRFYYRAKHHVNFRKLVRHRGATIGGPTMPGLARRKQGAKTGRKGPSLLADIRHKTHEGEEDDYDPTTPAEGTELTSPSVSLRASGRFRLSEFRNRNEDVEMTSTPMAIDEPTQPEPVSALPNGHPTPAPLNVLVTSAGPATSEPPAKKRRSGSSYWGMGEKTEFVRLYNELGPDFERISAGLDHKKTPQQCRNYLQKLEQSGQLGGVDDEQAEMSLPMPVAAPSARVGPVLGFFDRSAPVTDPGPSPPMPPGLPRRGSAMNIHNMLNVEESEPEEGAISGGETTSRAGSVARPTLQTWFEEEDKKPKIVSPTVSQPAQPNWSHYSTSSSQQPISRSYSDQFSARPSYPDYALPTRPPSFPADLSRYANSQSPPLVSPYSAASAYSQQTPSWDLPPPSHAATRPTAPIYPAPATIQQINAAANWRPTAGQYSAAAYYSQGPGGYTPMPPERR